MRSKTAIWLLLFAGLLILSLFDRAKPEKDSQKESDPFAATQAARALPFKDRVVIVAPKFDHPPVSAATIATAHRVIEHLPASVYKVLDKGGATINLAPNIIDKWPGSGDGMKPGQTYTMGEETGRTYDHDVHLYERSTVRFSTKLKEPYDQKYLEHNLLHEIGHAYDDCTHVYSKHAEFKEAHKLDVAAMPPETISNLKYFTNDSSEACAELTAGLLGADNYYSKECAKYFTHLKPMVKTQLGL